VLAAQGRPGIAVDMLGVMADATGRRRPAAAVAALAQCALVELDRGNLQRAVEHTDTIRDLNPRHHARTARAVGAYATGISSSAWASTPPRYRRCWRETGPGAAAPRQHLRGRVARLFQPDRGVTLEVGQTRPGGDLGA